VCGNQSSLASEPLLGQATNPRVWERRVHDIMRGTKREGGSPPRLKVGGRIVFKVIKNEISHTGLNHNPANTSETRQGTKNSSSRTKKGKKSEKR